LAITASLSNPFRLKAVQRRNGSGITKEADK